MTKPLRAAMPTVAAFIDEMRAAFGADAINAAIKSGIDGQPTFWAKENGLEVGTKAIYDPEKSVSAAHMQLTKVTAPGRATVNRR